VAGAPETRYAKADDGVHIAYQVFGQGDLDLVMIPGFISHVEMYWEHPLVARFLHRLGSFARVTIFDKRGTGLSDRTTPLPDTDQRMLDIQAVMDAAGTERAALLGISEGGPMSILFAASHPARTHALVLYGAYARTSWAPDFPEGTPADQIEELGRYVEERWGTGVGLAAWAPSIARDRREREIWSRFQRSGASPGAARALITTYGFIDVRSALPLVQAPTLVIHRRADKIVPVALGRHLAGSIDGARYVELDGEDHFFFTLDQDTVLDEIEEFLTGSRSTPDADRVLATVLFTDICGSTERAAALGDRRWRLVLDDHDATAARHVERFRGRLVKTTGDGILATFDGPARAVRCGRAISDEARSLGLDVRAGVHTGEVELRGDDVAGLGVHIAQRVCAVAGPGEVAVSRTVVDLAAGSGIDFTDHGDHDLKGVAGSWRLFLATH
jgi:class 3 adenylate cyclase